VRRKSTNAFPAAEASLVAATGFSIRIVWSGTTYSNGCPWRSAKIASFS
jgi:hypothetical protein